MLVASSYDDHSNNDEAGDAIANYDEVGCDDDICWRQIVN